MANDEQMAMELAELRLKYEALEWDLNYKAGQFKGWVDAAIAEQHARRAAEQERDLAHGELARLRLVVRLESEAGDAPIRTLRRNETQAELWEVASVSRTWTSVACFGGDECEAVAQEYLAFLQWKDALGTHTDGR